MNIFVLMSLSDPDVWQDLSSLELTQVLLDAPAQTSQSSDPCWPLHLDLKSHCKHCCFPCLIRSMILWMGLYYPWDPIPFPRPLPNKRSRMDISFTARLWKVHFSISFRGPHSNILHHLGNLHASSMNFSVAFWISNYVQPVMDHNQARKLVINRINK